MEKGDGQEEEDNPDDDDDGDDDGSEDVAVTDGPEGPGTLMMRTT